MVIVESEMQWYELNTADCRWVAQNLKIMFRSFNLVPGVPGFSWDLSLELFITWY